jgi:penicillin-binding protein A
MTSRSARPRSRQGEVQATALTMATVGLRGRRPRLTLSADAAGPAPTVRVTSPRVAEAVERMMLAVVRRGTGTAAALPGKAVAGKTGTAELWTTQSCGPTTGGPQDCDRELESDTDAWFAAYTPARRGRPRVAVGVMLYRSGAGGDTAAPVAREVLSAALAH